MCPLSRTNQITHGLRAAHLFLEALLPKVADSVIISIRKHALDIVTLALLFDLIHDSRAVALNLVFCAHGAEDNLRHPLAEHGPVCDAADDLAVVRAGKRYMLAIQDQA